MKNRIAAIINDSNENSEDICLNAKTLADSGCFDIIVIFTKFDIDYRQKIIFEDSDTKLDVYLIPEEMDIRPKVKNYVTKTIKDLYPSYHLHVIEDCIKINANPSKFIEDIENIMSKLDMNSYLGTITDACNYIYQKYNPRLNIAIDRDEYKQLGIDSILFCSHSNVQWIVYDLSKACDDELYFNEEFSIDMFWIIYYLAQRRNLHPQSMYFMNQYITCKSEYGLYSRIPNIKNGNDDSPSRMAEEDKIFRQKGIDFSPTNNIDMILERLYDTLSKKI